MKLAIRHQVSIALPKGTSRAVQHLLLTPRSGPTQTVRDWRIEIPGIAEAAGFTDSYGNRAHLVTQHKPPEELVVVAAGTVETHDRNGVLGRPQGEPVVGLFLRATPLTQPDPVVLASFDAKAKGGRIAILHALMEHVGVGLIEVEEPVEEAGQSQARGGQAQTQLQTQKKPAKRKLTAPDLSHSFIACARALHIPARYITGYLASEDKTPAFFHAWAEALDEGLGWIAFDPLLQLCPTDRHVRLAVGLDATSAAPVRAVPAAEPAGPAVLSVELAQ